MKKRLKMTLVSKKSLTKPQPLRFQIFVVTSAQDHLLRQHKIICCVSTRIFVASTHDLSMRLIDHFDVSQYVFETAQK